MVVCNAVIGSGTGSVQADEKKERVFSADAIYHIYMEHGGI